MKIKSHILSYLLALIPFVVTPFWYNPFITGRVVLWCMALLVALYIYWQQRISIRVFVRDPRLMWFGAFVLWLTLRAVCGGVLGVAWWGSWIRSDGLFLLWALLPIAAVLLYAPQKAKNTATIFLMVLLISTAVSRVAVLAAGYESLVTDPRWAGSVGNALFFGTIILFVPFFATHAFERTQHSRWLVAAAWIVAIVLLFQTGSRGTMIAACIGALVYGAQWLFQKIASKKRAALLLCGGVLCITALGWLVGGRALRVSAQDTTVQTRRTLYQNAFHEFAQRPIVGYAPAVFHDVIARDAGRIDAITSAEQVFDSTHSWYLDIALAGGVVALVLFAVWMWYVSASLTLEARATCIAYMIALATAPFQMWSLPVLLLLIALGQRTSQSVPTRSTREIYLHAPVAAVFIFCSIGFVIGLPIEAAAMQTGLSANATLGDVARAAAKTPAVFPYMLSRDVLYSQRLIGGLSQYIVPTFELSPLDAAYIPRLQVEGGAVGTSVYDTHHVAVFFQLYAPHASTRTSEYWQGIAEALYRNVLTRAPGRPATSVALAGLFSGEGRESDAGDVLAAFLAAYPDSPTAHFYWAVHLATTGDKVGARDFVAQALQLRPTEWNADQLAWMHALGN